MKRIPWRLLWTWLCVIVIVIAVTATGYAMLQRVMDETFEGDDQEVAEMPPPCELSMTCDSLHNPDDEVLDQADD